MARLGFVHHHLRVVCALACLGVSSCGYWSLMTPGDGAVVISDQILIGAKFTAEPPETGASFEWPEWPSEGHRMCITIAKVESPDDGIPQCVSNAWGSVGSGDAGVFAHAARPIVEGNDRNDRDGNLFLARFKMEIWVGSLDDKKRLSPVLRSVFLPESVSRCAAAAEENLLEHKRSVPAQERRVFDVRGPVSSFRARRDVSPD